MRKSGIVEERRENIFCRAAIAQCATHALRAVLACWQDVHVSHIFCGNFRRNICQSANCAACGERVLLNFINHGLDRGYSICSKLV